MTVTAFGGLFLPLTLFIVLFRRTWLLPLLCVAAVLHSPSVVDFTLAGERYGLTPFLVVASCCLLDLVRRVSRGMPMHAGSEAARSSAIGWSIFAAWSLLSTLTLPWVFAGVPVYAPLGVDGVDGDLSPLNWSASNAAQIVNLILISGVAAWLAQHARDPGLPRRFMFGMAAALIVSVLVGLQQRLAWNGLLPMWESFWASNPSYDQNFRTWAGPVPRVSWPFVEASYASAWFAAVLGGFVAMFLADVQRHRALLGVLVTTFALANTLGATGFLAAIAFVLLALTAAAAALVAMPRQRGQLFYRLVLAGLVCGCVGLATHLVLRHYGLLDLADEAFESLLQGQNETVLGDVRPQANWHALRVLADTWGLGVGMGSNRASSYLATLLSNRGAIGMLLFFAAVGLQFRALAYRIRRRPSAPAVFFFGSGIAALIAVSIAIPDQNWPVLWMLLLGGLACLGAEDAQGEPATDAAQPTRRGKAGDRPV